MATRPSRPRSRSFSGIDGDGGEPWYISQKALTNPRLDAARRAAVPRAASTSNMRNAAMISVFDTDDDDVARERFDRQALRDLAHFFRTTEPPSAPRESITVDNCFAVPSTSGSRRWSIQSLRKGKRGSMQRPSSLQLRRDATMARTTAAGHAYMAIPAPETGSPEASPTSPEKSGLPVLSRLNFPGRLDDINRSWPARSSSRTAMNQIGPLGPISPASSHASMKNDLKTVTDRHDDVESINSRTSSMRNFSHKTLKEVRSPGATSPTPLPSFSLSTSIEPVKEQTVWTSAKNDNDLVLIATPPDTPTLKTTEVKQEAAPSKDEPQRPTSSTGSTSHGHKRKLSAFPSTSPASGPRARPVSPKQQQQQQRSVSPKSAPPRPASPKQHQRPGSAGQQQKSPISPRPQSRPGSAGQQSKRPLSPKQQSLQSKKLANLVVKSMLEVPQNSVLPESPGFPKMLAAMTFPSPPESSPSHSASNSISSSIAPTRSGLTSPSSIRSEAMIPPKASLNERLLLQTRPPLRQYQSDSAAQKPSRADSTRIGEAKTALVVAHPARAQAKDLSAPATSEARETAKTAEVETPRNPSPDPSQEPTETRSQRESTDSTTDMSWQSDTMSDSNRQSLQSITSTSSDATTRVDPIEKQAVRVRESLESSSTVNTQPGGFRRLDETEPNSRASSRQQRRTSLPPRSETPSSIHSTSSAGASSASQSLADRRMARKARVREKFQRDLDASKAKLTLRLGGEASADALDSPVLGYFSPNGKVKPLGPKPSALSKEIASSPSPTTPTARRSSVQDITQLIPETVPENARPATAKRDPAPYTFSSIMVSMDEPDPDAEADAEAEVEHPASLGGADTAPGLKLTPIMVVANIEDSSPPSTLRPLSLSPSAGNSSLISRSSLIRPEGKLTVRPRPLPVRIIKSPLEVTPEGRARSKRHSSPVIQSPTYPTERESTVSDPELHQRGDRQSLNFAGILSSRVNETKWLQAQQRKTVQDWRLEAIEERVRREPLLVGKKPSHGPSKSIDSQAADETVGDSKNQQDPAAVAKKRASTSPSSQWSLLTKDSHASTLHALTSNSTTASGSMNGDDAHMGLMSPRSTRASSNFDQETEMRLMRVEKNGEVLLRGIMPLLENMNEMLKDLRRESLSREVSNKTLETMLMTSGASLDLVRRSLSYQPVTNQAPFKKKGPRPGSMGNLTVMARSEDSVTRPQSMPTDAVREQMSPSRLSKQ